MAPTAEQLVASLSEVDDATFKGDEAGRAQTVAAARKLLNRLETPMERCYDLMSVSWLWGTLQTFKDLGIWETWAKDGQEKSLEELAALASSDVDINLLRRLCRFLASMEIMEEVGEERYKPNRMSLFLGTSGTVQPQAWSDHWRYNDVAGFLKKSSYREIDDPKNTCYSNGTPEKLDFWARMASNPSYQLSWGGWMANWTSNKTPWSDYFNTNVLLDGTDLDGPVLVDVGGNKGNDLNSFLAKHPDIPNGSLVLQDLPVALELAAVSDKIKIMPHDFFTPQPVVGSRGYLFHAVIHDWDHGKALDILKNIAPAMKKGYSKLLICDIMIPPTGATRTQTTMEMAVMLMLAAHERTQADWEKLLGEAGFKISKLWPDPRGFETLIEAELA
ncbi:putative O-methyltransferase [Thozetella sp. PMI_491]|nr:putative O-methyltransferase [Thozetella sp. PMI_491]